MSLSGHKPIQDANAEALRNFVKSGPISPNSICAIPVRMPGIFVTSTPKTRLVRAFLAGSGEVRFAGQCRAEIYAWTERTLLRHQYAGLSHSCLAQDEPERGFGFSHRMRLKDGIGMLGIDHQHERFGSDEFSEVASRPAVAGDTITFYGIGFGDVTPYAPAGQVRGGQNALAQPFGMTFVSGSQQAKGTVSVGRRRWAISQCEMSWFVSTLTWPAAWNKLSAKTRFEK